MRLKALRRLRTRVSKETLLKRTRSVGRHAAMMAKPASIMDQWRSVEIVTAEMSAGSSAGQGDDQHHGSTLASNPAFVTS